MSGCSFFDPIFYTTVYSIKHLNRCLSLISSFFKPLYRKHESNHPKTQIRLIPYSKAFNSPTLHTRYYLDSLRLACSASHNLSLFLLSFSIHLEPWFLCTGLFTAPKQALLKCLHLDCGPSFKTHIEFPLQV